MKNYKVSVPVMLRLFKGEYREKAVKELKSIGAERVFLAIGFYLKNPDKRQKMLEELKDAVSYLKKQGFEVGVWMWSVIVKEENDYRKLTDLAGNPSDAYVCPTDEDFVRFAEGFVADVADCNPDLIMFDDDMRYNYADLGCSCSEHLARFSDAIGRKVTHKDVQELCFIGKPSPERAAWLKVNGDVLREFAKRLRNAIDSVNPDIRCGYCTSDSSWGLDGFSADELARILAGKTKPFLRLFGAPYWKAHYGFSLAHVVENERMAASWLKDSGIENMSEGDVYPRPRYAIPASHLECFDTVLRADGNTDGILKYSFDYTSGMDSETGYNDFHKANMPLYVELEKHFAGKPAAGVRVYEYPNRIQKADFFDRYDSDYVHRYCFDSHAGKILGACGIPMCREGEGMPGVCFGENARLLPESVLDNGLILDLNAAKILSERGIDTGLEAIIGKYTPGQEVFSDGDAVKIWGANGIYAIKVKEGAVVDSKYVSKEDYSLRSFDSTEEYPSAYFYENAKGQRFFVMVFDSVFCEKTAYRSYAKARQLIRAAEYVGRKSLPAKCTPSPDAYLMCKKDEKSMSVGLWNMNEDKILNHEIETDKEYKNVRFINVSGTVNGNKITLSTVYPYEFAGFIAEE